MKSRATILMAIFLILAACQFNVPLSTVHNIAIDPVLLGSWEMLPEEDEPEASLDSMMISKLSDTEYKLIYFSEGAELNFRAYLIEAGGDQLVQLEFLDDGAEDSEKKDHDKQRFMVAKHSLENGQLSVSTLNTKVISKDIDTTQALLAAYLENKNNPELFTNPGRFKKD